MYNLLRNALFLLSPETSHEFSMDSLGALNRLKMSGLIAAKNVDEPCEFLGLKLKNPVGLAAGLDKNGDYIDALDALGFGYVEVGTVTPLPQRGNDKPRLFRLPEKKSIINRMGFNNKGIDHLVEQVKNRKSKGVVGINIGKNKNTPAELAVNDYLICLEKAYEVADYITINLSSPNTPGLRDLQFGEPLNQLLGQLKDKQVQLDNQTGLYRPILVKIAPDMEAFDIEQVAKAFVKYGIDGAITTNTTIKRDAVQGLKHCDEMGGLSGAVLLDDSNTALRVFKETVGDKMPIIGVGGITKGEDAISKIKNGADVVQIYSGFIYEGPKLISDCVNALRTLK
ncbi:MAG: quinone-dependent dihydroorotate dehydrogenase [Saccharospirillaceae bacterium]|nr:quinone-dependent dihydroorotate dehydrogenase [Pseudomonadales bacterium]NRB79063.1 quinone-dependent dihydroorotate dehydrogenase [Saccharospirillaceae bacterium]